MKIKLAKRLSQFNLEVDLEISNSGICVIFGRSGSGKTSLINMIAGIDTPDSGHISINDQVFYDADKNINTVTHQRNIGYVFQQSRLFPHLNVQQNLRYGYHSKDDAQGSFYQRIIELLNLSTLLTAYPDALSGGEMQRVAIGRALLCRPKLLLMDEPLAALDLPLKRELLPYLENLNSVLSLPILYVTHSLDEVLFLADEMLLIERGQCILQGSVEQVWNHPKMMPWLNNGNHCAIINTQLIKQHGQYPLSALAINATKLLWVKEIKQPLNTAVRIRIYAKDVSITTSASEPSQTSIRNILQSRVSDIQIEEQIVKVKLALTDTGTNKEDTKDKTIAEAINTLWAEITVWALDDLQLAIGDTVFAQIKGVSISQDDWAKH
ncbi:molybdenum ABC transporter ATP-binding protein ModC [Gammaproteobacteria bacterium AS21]